MNNKKDNNKKTDSNGKRKRLVYKGTIVEPLKDFMFHVRLEDNGESIMGYVSENMRRNHIHVAKGDGVQIVLSHSDSKQGMITYRLPPRLYKGTIVEPIKGFMFHVRLEDNGESIMGYVSENMRRNHIRVGKGDEVKIEMSHSDSKQGRIIYRLSRADSQTRLKETKSDHQAKGDHIPPESSLDTETTNPISSDPIQSADQEEKREERGDTKDTNPNQDLSD